MIRIMRGVTMGGLRYAHRMKIPKCNNRTVLPQTSKKLPSITT